MLKINFPGQVCDVGSVLVGWLDKVKLKLTQTQVELEAWAELGK